MELMVAPILVSALRCEWVIGSLGEAMITTCGFIGMMIGSPLWGKICDHYGRRVGLIASSLETFVFGTLSAFSPNFPCFLILRTLTGIGIAGFPQAITLYSEFLPTFYRAKCIILVELFWSIGAAAGALLALWMMEPLGWRWLIFLTSLPLLFTAIACIWLPESARYLFASGEPTLTRLALERIARMNGEKMLEGRIVEINHARKGSGESESSESNLTVRKSTTDTVINQRRGHLPDLFGKSLRMSTLLLWFIW